MKRVFRLVVVAAVAAGWQVTAPAAALAQPPVRSIETSCELGNGIQHVINIVFDNVHLTRDNPNVPSDLEQMPSLLNFIESNGTMITHNYTPLISHTADDIVTTLTGLYPDQQGLAVANSYAYYAPNGTEGGFPSAFQYWTDKIGSGAYNNVTAAGQNTPAPWVPFTRAGCNVGGVSTANIELENNGNIPVVFGATSPEAAEAAASDPHTGQPATGDFIGIAIHCAKGAQICETSNHGVPDLLPEEPGGYNGFNALFGHKYVAPQIAPSGLNDLNGNPITQFPGFGGISAAQSLAYVAAMEEHGVPVTYAYISDAHDNHSAFGTFGPGEAGYEAQLKSYDKAFAAFFSRLAADGITPRNTLFNFSSDENDHFAGAAGSPAGCNGITVPCTYVHSGPSINIGEIDTNMTALMAGAGVTTSFDLHFDDAPAVYLLPQTGRTDAVTRKFEQAAATLVDPSNHITGQATPLMQRMADPVEMKLLHMITGDPSRTPTFIYFGNPDYYFQTFGSPDYVENSGFAWNHGDFQPEIVTSWLGLVGPGVLHLGADNRTWADHADTRPTIMALTGLHDDYASEGRVLTEDLRTSALPDSLRDDASTLQKLGQIYKQINAPVGAFGLDSLQVSTTALASTSAGDKTYNALEEELMDFGHERDFLAAQMSSMLNAAAFRHQAINEARAKELIEQGQELLADVHAAASI